MTSDNDDDAAERELGLPADWRELSPEAKKALLLKLRGRHISLGLGGPRKWRRVARPKQLAPDDPKHHLPDSNGFSCRCDGPDENWNIWMFMAGRGCGKRLDVNTPIITPSGWVCLGDLVPGDFVFDHAGRPTRVLAVYDGVPEVAYRLTFADGAQLEADAEHLWTTWTHADRKQYLHEGNRRFHTDWPAWRAPSGRGPRVRTTEEIVRTLGTGIRSDTSHCVPVCAPLEFPEADLPIDPYVLGAWLGDGTSVEAYITIADSDADEILGYLAERGAPVTGKPQRKPGARCMQYPIGGKAAVRDEKTGRLTASDGMRAQLSNLGVRGNKHVPEQYLRGSAEQRLELLRGLMDTDGSIHQSNSVEFSNTNKSLVDAVVYLACSLGQKPTVHEKRATLYGKDCGPCWRVMWTPTIQVFRMRRKAEKLSYDKAQSLRNHHRMIKTAERIDPKPMRCITVESEHGLFLAGKSMIPTHNTWAGANWIIEQALKNPGTMWAVVAPTFRDVRVTCFEGPSGIRRQLEPGEEQQWRRNELRLDLVNGSVIYGYSADQPERLRGSNLSGCWADEMGSWQYEETWYEGLVPALRIGEHPRVMVTTTPRPTHLIRDLFGRRDGTVHITTASTWENAANLSAAALDELRRRYEGTRLGRQELEGELLEDLEGALWKRSDIDAARLKPGDVPDLVRVVVGVDPAVTSGEDSDETGIIVAGDDGHGHGYILADYSMQGTPEACMREAVRAYKRHRADCVVAEVNNGGDFVGTVLRTIDPDVPYHTVRASRGKAIRAEPVSSLAEQRRLHHVGSFPELEDQMCSLTPGMSSGPDDRVDACVWAVFELRGLSQASWLAAYGAMRCAKCDHAYSSGLKGCPRCGTENPAEAGRLESRRGGAGGSVEAETDDEPTAGGWAAVYRLRKCPRGHAYSDRGSGCQRCQAEGLGFLRQNGKRMG